MSVKKKAIKKTKQSVKTASPAVSIEHREKAEREKTVAMWAGVIFFMVIIFSFWTISFKNSIRGAVKEESSTGAEFDKVITDFNGILEKTKNNFTELQETMDSGSIAAKESTAKDSEIQALESRLNEVEEKMKLEKFLDQLNDKLSGDKKIEEKR